MESLSHPIQWLQHIAEGLGVVRESTYWQELQKVSFFMSGYTIGIEIEILWHSYFPELKKKWFGITGSPQIRGGYESFTEKEKAIFSAECGVAEAEIRRKLELTRTLGIPRGEDAYWEFAIPPFPHVSYLIVLLEILDDAGLLPHDRAHSLHVTIGGLRPSVETGFLLSHLESLSGVTSDRILRGFHEKDSRYNAGWARRGVAGMKLRPPEELIGNTLFATEFRTLVLPVGRKARNIFFAQIGELAQILVKPAIERLSEEAQLWSNIYKKIELRHTEASLPLDRTEWGNPDSEPGLWRRWGEVN